MSSSSDPVASKIAIPYGRAFFEFVVDEGTVHQSSRDLASVITLIEDNPELEKYLHNPFISQEPKVELLMKLLKSKVDVQTRRFVTVLILRNRINLLKAVNQSFLNALYKSATVKAIDIETAFAFTKRQQRKLTRKIQKLTGVHQVRLKITVDSSLIGGFLMKTESKVIDYTVINQLQKIAKHLDTVLEI